MKSCLDDALKFIEDEAIVISRPGVRLSKKNDRLHVYEGEKRIGEIPFYRIKSITLSGRGISLSTDIIRSLNDHEIELVFLDRVGRPYGSFVGNGYLTSSRIRREQYRAYDDKRGAYLARTFALAKVRNQYKLIQYFNRGTKNPRLDEILNQIKDFEKKIESASGKNAESVQSSIMGWEGSAARAYWQGVGELLIEKVGFSGRELRGTNDPANMCFNYGYGILYGEVWRTLLRKGLDPYAGFLHRERDGKAALVFDFVEEFRQLVVDRALIATFRRGWRPELDRDGNLKLDSRKHILEQVKGKLQEKNEKILRAMASQAQSLVNYLLGQGTFTPDQLRWW